LACRRRPAFAPRGLRSRYAASPASGCFRFGFAVPPTARGWPRRERQRSMAGAHGPLLLCLAGTEIAKGRRQNHRRQSSKAGLMSYSEPGRCVSVPVNTVPEFITHAKGNRKPLRSRRSGAILSREIPETA
jgi:hypothetical protein